MTRESNEIPSMANTYNPKKFLENLSLYISENVIRRENINTTTIAWIKVFFTFLFLMMLFLSSCMNSPSSLYFSRKENLLTLLNLVTFLVFASSFHTYLNCMRLFIIISTASNSNAMSIGNGLSCSIISPHPKDMSFHVLKDDGIS